MEFSMSYHIHWYVLDDPNFEGDMWDSDTLESAQLQAQDRIDTYPGPSGASIMTPDNDYVYLGVK